jgi:hypothetical protein
MAVFQGDRHQGSLVHSELEQLFRPDNDLVSPRNRIHSSPERPSTAGADCRSTPATGNRPDQRTDCCSTTSLFCCVGAASLCLARQGLHCETNQSRALWSAGGEPSQLDRQHR